MAKTNTVLIKLDSSADTGYYYVTKFRERRLRNSSSEIRSVARKHVLLKEAK